MKRKLSYLAMAATLGFSLQAQAEQVRVIVRAKVTSIEDFSHVLDGKIKAGDTIDGIYTYETDLQDANPHPDFGSFAQPKPGITLKLNGYYFSTDPANTVYSAHTSNGPAGQTDGVELRSTSHLFELAEPGEHFNAIVVNLVDMSGVLLASDALPASVPQLSQLTRATVLLTSASATGKFNINADITGLVTCTDKWCR